MKRIVIGVAPILCCAMLCSCGIGGYGVDFSDGKLRIEVDGSETAIDFSSTRVLIDQMLDSVALPDGTTDEQLKKFVDDGLDKMGIDVDSVSTEELQKAIDGLLDQFNSQAGTVTGSGNSAVPPESTEGED